MYINANQKEGKDYIVYLNGKYLPGCIEADSKKGYATVVRRDDIGKIGHVSCIDNKLKILTKKLYGKIEFVEKDENFKVEKIEDIPILTNKDIVIFLNGKLESYAFEADDVEGYIVRYVVDESGKVKEDEKGILLTEKIEGKVTLKNIHTLKKEDLIYKDGQFDQCYLKEN